MSMALLYMDPLDLWLMLMGMTFLVLSFWVIDNFFRKKNSGLSDGLSIALIVLGIYSLVTGIWATVTWPLPGSYNIVLMDAWPLFGIGLLTLGLSIRLNVNLRGALLGIAVLSFPILIYGLVILSNGMTKEPELAALMYITSSLAGLLSPLLTFGGTVSRTIGIVIVLLLLIAAIISLVTGVGATFSHVQGWKSWTPWYGSKIVS